MNDHRELPGFLAGEICQLLLFSGKGGVGKTTASAATALNLANRNPDKSILLISTDPAHSLQDSLDGAILPTNLKVVELDTQACILDFKEKNRQRLMEIATRGTFLDEEDINRFLDLSLPGMDEIMSFLEISRWVKQGTYAGIVVDTAPTGHTMRLLGMPELMGKWLKALDILLAKYRYMKKLFRGYYQQDDLDLFINGLTSDVLQMKELLKDTKRCRFIPVMLAEALSVEETLDLIRELKRLGIRTRDVIINRLFPDTQCSLCRDTRARQNKQLSRLFDEPLLSGLHLWGVPMYPQEVKGLAGLLPFWDGVFPVCEPSLESQLVLPSIPTRVMNPIPLPSPNSTLLIFAGKGGVGKTTLACATALWLASVRKDKKILLFSVDPAHSLSDCLDIAISSTPTPITPSLWAMEINASLEFTTLKNQYQQEVSELLTKIMPNMDLAYDREAMERLMDLSPAGIDELMALSKMMDLLTRDHFDVLILDSAPTGHLLRLLELPEIIEAWLKAIFGIFLKYKKIFRLPKVTERLVNMSKDLKTLRAMLHDSSRAALCAVSILTEMSFSETGDLLAACKKMAIPVPHLFLNLATPDSTDPLCSSIFRRESLIRQRFASEFSDMSQTLVFRQSDSLGIENLSALGQALYLRNPV